MPETMSMRQVTSALAEANLGSSQTLPQLSYSVQFMLTAPLSQLDPSMESTDENCGGK